MTDAFGLSDDEHKRIYARIEKKTFAGTRPLKQPRIVITGGQPGSGKSRLIELSKEEFKDGNVVVINGDDLRYYHPQADKILKADDKRFAEHTDPDSRNWTRELFDKAIETRRNIIFESTLREFEEARKIYEKYDRQLSHEHERKGAPSKDIEPSRQDKPTRQDAPQGDPKQPERGLDQVKDRIGERGHRPDTGREPAADSRKTSAADRSNTSAADRLYDSVQNTQDRGAGKPSPAIDRLFDRLGRGREAGGSRTTGIDWASGRTDRTTGSPGTTRGGPTDRATGFDFDRGEGGGTGGRGR